MCARMLMAWRMCADAYGLEDVHGCLWRVREHALFVLGELVKQVNGPHVLIYLLYYLRSCASFALRRFASSAALSFSRRMPSSSSSLSCASALVFRILYFLAIQCMYVLYYPLQQYLDVEIQLMVKERHINCFGLRSTFCFVVHYIHLYSVANLPNLQHK